MVATARVAAAARAKLEEELEDMDVEVVEPLGDNVPHLTISFHIYIYIYLSLYLL